MDSLQSIIDLGKKLEESKDLEKKVYDLKVEKGQLEHDIQMFKNMRQDEKLKSQVETAKCEEKMLGINKSIADLEHKRDSLAIEVSTKMNDVNKLQIKLDQDANSLLGRENRIQASEKRIVVENEKIERKKEILTKIKDLAQTL